MLEVIFRGWRKSGRLDLEAVELAVRSAMHRSGAKALGRLLSDDGQHRPGIECACGWEARLHSVRRRRLLSAVGAVEFERAYYRCPRCRQGLSPRDRELQVEGTQFSPGVRRMMATVGSDQSFQHGRDQIALLAGVELTAKAVERHAEAIGGDIEAGEQDAIARSKQLEIPEMGGPETPILYIEMDGTGVPTVKAETVGRAGKRPDQPAHTREVKLGCVFTQTKVDEQGRPLRDADSTSYVAAIETAQEFGPRLYAEARRRGWSRARKKVVIGDGAPWIWNLAQQHFPGAIQIVDLFHAREHLWELAAKLFPHSDPDKKRWLAKMLALLDDGRITQLVAGLRACQANEPRLLGLANKQADYFERNAERMNYPQYRSQGLFVGSGVIEAGCKTVVAQRLKRSGMFWTVRGANAILALRCCRLNGNFEDYWQNRARAA